MRTYIFLAIVVFLASIAANASDFPASGGVIRADYNDGRGHFLWLEGCEGESSTFRYRKYGSSSWNPGELNGNMLLENLPADTYYEVEVTGSCSSTGSTLLKTFALVDTVSAIMKELKNPLFLNFKDKGDSRVYNTYLKEIFFTLPFASQRTFELVILKDYTLNKVVDGFLLTEPKEKQEYRVDLENYLLDFEHTYSLELTSVHGHRFAIRFRVLEVPEGELPAPTIMPDPLSLNCATGEAVIDFIGSIQAGKAPYSFMWMVFEGNGKEKLLFQPVAGTTAGIDEAPKILVDHPVGYTVLFGVRDACGQYNETYMYVDCEELEEQGETLFIQLLDPADADGNSNGGG